MALDGGRGHFRVSVYGDPDPDGRKKLKGGYWASISVREGDTWKDRLNIWSITSP